MNIPSCPLMIGVSSQQNSTNLVPFLQFKGGGFLLLETELAQKKGWSCGIRAVVERRNKEIEILSIGSGLGVNETMTVLRQKIASITEPICWNIGGGQKIQTLPLIISFQERVSKGCPDWLCYSEPQTRTTTLLLGDGSIQQLPTVVPDLNLEDISQTFGYGFENSKHRLLWQRINADTGECFKDQLLTEAQIDFFYKYENRQRMLDYTYTVEFEQKETDLGSVFNDGPLSLGDYFERVVQTQAAWVVAADPGSHRINQVWVNVTVVSEQRPDDKQEFDVVLVTDFGTLIALDAKTYKFDKKDADARTHNLNKVSGLYTDFWAVFPFFRQDIDNPKSFLQANREWKKLLLRPFQIKERGGRMLVVTENDNKDFALCKGKGKGNKIETCVPDQEGALRLHFLSGMLNTLKLTVDDKQH